MRKFLSALVLLLTVTLAGYAQQAERRLVAPSMPFFVPHWYVKAQVGGAYDVGEAKFTQLVSPAAQLALGYKFNEFFGLRGTLSGLWARNRYAYPEAKYSWNFIQPAIEAEADLTNLFFGFDPERPTSLYAFLGAGVAFAFNDGHSVTVRDGRIGDDGQDGKDGKPGRSDIFGSVELSEDGTYLIICLADGSDPFTLPIM